ncbi:hypothetical protein Pla8534_67340 [Lignipirellula cremea]|uniref:Uncharacterized protein n=1 Tax=Lignipirellula cremea TaxID=2528010 RepID=A0A518E440_9BACT|nr:hypothetical protein Pla8534_67340 [Lignipirellula cremea]
MIGNLSDFRVAKVDAARSTAAGLPFGVRRAFIRKSKLEGEGTELVEFAGSYACF